MKSKESLEKKGNMKGILHTILITLATLIFYTVPVFASTVVDFSPFIEMLYSVMKAIGVIVAIFGIITFIKGFASDQPEAKVQAGMIIAAGILLFSAQQIVEGLGLTL